MLGLTLLGAPRLLAREAIEAAVGARRAVLPPEYVDLMMLWGPGLLCGVVELPDPTSDRFRFLQNRLRVEGGARRREGAWGTLTDEQFAAGLVLGVDRRGCAYFAMAANQIALLHPNGIMLTLGTFADVVRNFLVGNKLVELEPAFIEIGVKQWYWNYRGPRDDHPLGVPAVYVTDEPSWRPALMAAWRSSDEGMADAALARVLEREVTGWAMFELLHYLASPAAAEIPSEIRATYVDQLYRIANRRLPKLVPDLDIRKVRIALTKGELAPEQLAPLAALIEAPSGIFIGDYDATTPLSSRSWPMRLPTTPRASCTRITSRRTARSSARKRFAPTPRA